MLKFIAIIVGLVAVTGTGTMARSHAFRHHLQGQLYEDIYYLPSHEWLELGSVGYREAGASLLWLRSLVYCGDELVRRGATRHLQRYTSAITTLDPAFKRVYSWAATMSVFRTRATTLNDVNYAIDILLQGRQQFPEDGELAWKLGSTYTYDLRPFLKNSKEHDEASSKGREMFRIAAALGGGPPWSVLTVAAELTELGQTEQARQQMMEVYETIDNEQAKRQLELRLEKLNSSAFVLALRATVQEFNQMHANDFPYLDSGIYYLLDRPDRNQPQAPIERFFDPTTSLSRKD